VGGVDDGVDLAVSKKRRQTLRPAETADPLRDRRGRRVGGRTGQRQLRVDARVAGQAAGERARFRGSAENEEAKALQGTAP